MTELQQKKLNNGREYRSLSMDAAEDYMVEGYATTFNEPYYLYKLDNGKTVNEMVDADAFKEADMSDVIFQFDHEGKVYARLSNETMALETDEHGLKVRAYLGGTEGGRNLYEEIKGGYINKMSFGFTVAESKIEPDGKDYLRTIKRIGKLYDVSAVSIPQNDFTVISARKQCDGVIAELEEEILKAEEEKRRLIEQKESLARRLKAMRGEKDGN